MFSWLTTVKNITIGALISFTTVSDDTEKITYISNGMNRTSYKLVDQITEQIDFTIYLFTPTSTSDIIKKIYNLTQDLLLSADLG